MPHFECGAFDHSATSPLRWSALSKRGVLLAAKTLAGKRQIQDLASFYLDTFFSVAYARMRSGVEKFHASFLVRILKNAALVHRQDGDPEDLSLLQPTDKKTAALLG